MSASADVQLPVVSASTFLNGASWTWDYFADDGSMYSSERYSVIDVRGTVVTLEIASDYGGSQNLKPNTRIEVDYAKCLAAYAGTVKKAWKFRMFYLSQAKADSGVAKWTEFDPPSTLAFEEKFNCNGRQWPSTSTQYATEYSRLNGVAVFRQKLWRKLEASWFAVQGQAVQVQKNFATGYISRLRP